MKSGNNIHVQQHTTNVINEKWNKTQNDASFVAFYDMHAVMFVLPDEMADMSIAVRKNLGMSKLNAFAAGKVYGSEMMISLSERVRNIVGKGENAGFSSSNSVSKSLLFQGHLKLK